LVKRNRRTRIKEKHEIMTLSYMIRVESMNDCCCCEDDVVVAGREAIPVSNDVDGVLNGDCLLHKSGGTSSIV
jgi:hypothetical protein